MANDDDSARPEQLYHSNHVLAPELAKSGDLAVGVTTLQIDGPNMLNPASERKLALEVWYPSEVSEGPPTSYSDVTRAQQAFTLQGQAHRDAKPISSEAIYPLVILSHGYSGYRSMMFYLGEHLASHGYVVASVDHTDSTNKEIDFKTNPGAGFHSTLLHRTRDQQTVLDYFTKQGEQFGTNANLASVVGFSMGGYGALNTVGACYQFDDSKAKQFGFNPKTQKDLLTQLNTCNAGMEKVDSRWRAVITLAPWGGEQDVIGGLKNISVPSLFIAGREDDVSGYTNGVKKLFDNTGAKHKYLMVFDQARHNIAPHPAPAVAYNDELALGHYLEPAWSTEALNNINKHMILAFLNCHAKNDSEFCEILPQTENSTQNKLPDGSFSPAWPGFKDRFGVGVWFYRG